MEISLTLNLLSLLNFNLIKFPIAIKSQILMHICLHQFNQIGSGQELKHHLVLLYCVPSLAPAKKNEIYGSKGNHPHLTGHLVIMTLKKSKC